VGFRVGDPWERLEEVYRMLGHLSFKPSSQRIYNKSAMGDLRTGSASATKGSDVEGNPLISCSSVTTSPFEVISLFLMTRLCGNKTREVLICCLTALFLPEIRVRKWKARVDDLVIETSSLIDAREDIDDQVVCEIWIHVPELRETT